MWKLLFNSCFIVLLLPLIASLINVCQGSHSSLQIEDGYKGVVIAISPEINPSQSDRNDFIEKIKDLIQKSSKTLYEATEQKLFFEEVTIIVPKSWTDINPTPQTPSQRYSDADIIITERDEVHSFSMQFAGCGQHALPIVVTKQLILGVNQQMRDRLLVHEWAHYRFGVFNEYGFRSDPMYPTYYSLPGNPEPSPKVEINSCADQFHLEEQFHLVADDCPMSTGNMTGKPINDQCFPLPDISSNSFESSLMYSHSVVNVTKFCGSQKDKTKGVHKHNVNSPNKQNILCDDRDVFSVISSHKDMQRDFSQKKFSETVFKIWRQTENFSPRTLFAIKKSAEMKENKRNLMINAALNKFFKIDMPSSKAAIFTYSDQIYERVSWMKATDALDQLNLIFNKPSVETDFENLLSEGLTFFESEDNDGNGGVFVIFIGGKSIVNSNSISKITTICKKLREKNIKLKIILFPILEQIVSRAHSTQLFEAAISITGGQVFPIREVISNPVSTANQIMKALGTVLNDHSGGDTSAAYHLISEQVFNETHLSQKSITFEFTIDETLFQRTIRVYLVQSFADRQDLNGGSIINSVALKDPQNIDKGRPDLFDPFHYVQGYTVYIDKSDLIGSKWKLTAEVQNKPGESVLAVAEFSSKSIDEDVIKAKCWLNINIDYKGGPIIAYLQLNDRFDGLVSNANVKLIVRFSENRYTNDPMIEMIDDGKGDPDITKGDGIYSQYIVNIANQGYYIVSALITNNKTDDKLVVTNDFGSTSMPTTLTDKTCCGSHINGNTKKKVTQVYRSVECGAFYSNNPITVKNYPPNTVRDLQVERVDYENRTVSLRWTSTGGVYTFNNVQKYEIKTFQIGKNEDDLQLRQRIRKEFDGNSFVDKFTINSNLQQNYGQEQKAVLNIKSEEGGVYYIALKAINNQEKKSSVSNIVRANIKSNVKIKSTTALVDVSISPVGDGYGVGGGDNKFGLQWYEWLSIGIGIGVVLLIVIIITICFVGKKRRKEDESDRRTEQMPQRRAPDPPRVSPELEKSQSILLDNGSYTHSVEKLPNINVNGIHPSNNSNISYDSGSQQNLRELSANTLSPIQSWDAKDLLTHWGRVQDAKSRHEAPPVLRIEDIESQSSNRSQSYASSEDDNTAIYTNPHNWRYQDVTARPTYIHNNYEPHYRGSVDPIRANTPSDNVPRYSTINRVPTQNVSQV